MNLSSLRFLLSPAGQALLEEAAALEPTDASLLADLTYLRKRFSPEESAAALKTVFLRAKALSKFHRANAMFFTQSALEQASGELIAGYRAGRYQALGARWVADLACGIGGDSLALAGRGPVLGVDWDELRLAMAVENCRAYDRASQFQPLLADLQEWRPVGIDALFFDPGRRREDGRRIFTVSDYRPPLSIIERWLPRVPHIGGQDKPWG